MLMGVSTVLDVKCVVKTCRGKAQWGKQCSEVLSDHCCSTDISRMIKLITVGVGGSCSTYRERGGTYRALVGKPERYHLGDL